MEELNDINCTFYVLQVQQCGYPNSRHLHLYLRYCWGVACNGNTQRFPTRFATSLGGVPEQVLRRRRLQVPSILVHIDW